MGRSRNPLWVEAHRGFETHALGHTSPGQLAEGALTRAVRLLIYMGAVCGQPMDTEEMDGKLTDLLFAAPPACSPSQVAGARADQVVAVAATLGVPTADVSRPPRLAARSRRPCRCRDSAPRRRVRDRQRVG